MRIPALAAASAALILAASSAACSGTAGHTRPTADGAIAGTFVIEGGPSGAPPEQPVPGTIRFAAAGRRTVKVYAGRSGRFTARLAPGYYLVSGTTPNIHGPGNQGTTCAQKKARVSADRKTYLLLACYVP